MRGDFFLQERGKNPPPSQHPLPCLHGPSLSTEWRGTEGEDSKGRTPQPARRREAGLYFSRIHVQPSEIPLRAPPERPSPAGAHGAGGGSPLRLDRDPASPAAAPPADRDRESRLRGDRRRVHRPRLRPPARRAAAGLADRRARRPPRRRRGLGAQLGVRGRPRPLRRPHGAGGQPDLPRPLPLRHRAVCARRSRRTASSATGTSRDGSTPPPARRAPPRCPTCAPGWIPWASPMSGWTPPASPASPAPRTTAPASGSPAACWCRRPPWRAASPAPCPPMSSCSRSRRCGRSTAAIAARPLPAGDGRRRRRGRPPVPGRQRLHAGARLPAPAGLPAVHLRQPDPSARPPRSRRRWAASGNGGCSPRTRWARRCAAPATSAS